MNAPTDRALAQAFEQVPVTAIVTSSTLTQQHRSQRFDAQALSELTRDVQARGIVLPVVLVAATPDTGYRYELVDGERRWRAACAAGLETVPAVIMPLDRAALIDTQVAANKHRESLHPLDEACALQELIDSQGLSVEGAGERLGLSRAHAYNRLKLLKLADEVLAALESGKLPATHAVHIARVPGHKLQKKALRLAIEPPYPGAPLRSERQLAEALRDKFMVRLDHAVFSLHHPELSDRGACFGCEHCSRNDAELEAEVVAAYGNGAILCMDKPCFEQKEITWHANRVEEARRTGRRVIEGEEAKKAQVGRYLGFGDLLDLDDICDAPVDEALFKALGRDPDAGALTYREILGEGVQPDLLVTEHATPLDVLPMAEALRLLEAKGIKPTVDPQDNDPFGEDEAAPDHRAVAEEQRKQQAREELERATRHKLLDLVHDKWKGPLKRDDLAALVDWLCEQLALSTLPIFDWYYQGKVDTAKMSERDLGRLLLELMLSNCVEYLGDAPNHLNALAKRHKIDPAKVRAQVKKALGGDEEKAAPKKKAGAKKGKKK